MAYVPRKEFDPNKPLWDTTKKRSVEPNKADKKCADPRDPDLCVVHNAIRRKFGCEPSVGAEIIYLEFEDHYERCQLTKRSWAIIKTYDETRELFPLHQRIDFGPPIRKLGTRTTEPSGTNVRGTGQNRTVRNLPLRHVRRPVPKPPSSDAS